MELPRIFTRKPRMAQRNGGGEGVRDQDDAAVDRFLNWEESKRLAELGDKVSEHFEEDQPKTAQELLLEPDFFSRLVADIGKAGLVRERRNALATYIIATSRLREKPLNGIVKGASSSGKNHLAKTVLKFLPESEVISASTMTAHALDYAGTNRLSHKLVYIDEYVGMNHPLRQLISEGRQIRWATEMENGVRVTKEHVTKGPVACITTTTRNALAIDDESRNLSIWIDESAAQTQEIAKSFVARHKGLSPQRLTVWRNVQHRIAKRRAAIIDTPPWFEDIANKILPCGDLRIRRYWPVFVEACEIVALIRASAWPEEDKELTVSFDDFAAATCIFDRVIGNSLTRSGGDAEMAIGDLVERLSAGQDGVGASELVGQHGIRSVDQAYRALRKARDAGTVFIVNPRERNNEKRYARMPVATFLGTPEFVAQKIGLRISGHYVHPITGKRIHYGQ
jgi:hypothetical protein